MNIENKIAQNLLQIKAIKLNPQNPFTWASGMRSPIYCDNRITLSYPDVRDNIKLGLVELANRFDNVDMIAGVATAGIAHGALLADALRLPFCYVRSAPKGHGRQNQIEGEIPEHSNIIVVEDLISTGGSSIEVVEILRKEGHNILGVIAVFDYGFEKARENFRKIQCNYFSLSNYNTLIQEARVSDYITKEEEAILTSWNQNPENWYTQNFQ
ncbi:MAG TPA: orotate phosphoribosyltransferase [Saprospiraceae bacterium]|jgi:orotate phosphoribosyltransferase|nr:orotate phosphoribosyltransferase [Saprospiraceae bacterium]HRO09326.1 orotate phosphoribosyltransferase [Saprospiraceae bacterium]HRP42563.1 orotate phosphoribosyltransferase [Saprospiraceae bacterium]